MEWIVSEVAEHPFFAEMQPHHIQLLAANASPVLFNRGQYIFAEGSRAEKFYLIQRGLIALESAIPGKGPMVIQTIGAGDVLGWSWLFEPYTWTFASRAEEPTDTWSFDAEAIRAHCRQDHELGYELLRRFAQVVIQRLQSTRLQMLDIYAAHPSLEVSNARIS